MPYKNLADRRAWDQRREEIRQRRYWEELGFSFMSSTPNCDVQCDYCGKVSPRRGFQRGMARHYEECILFRPQRHWSRRRKETDEQQRTT